MGVQISPWAQISLEFLFSIFVLKLTHGVKK
jgi:hypothetical protein